MQSPIRTSRLVTGLSSNERCVSREKFRSGSRSASSAKLLEVRVKVVRLGREVASVDWMLLSLLRARRRVRSRGERGKLERAVMSLSVKSMASWSYIDYCSVAKLSVQFRTHGEAGRKGGINKEEGKKTKRRRGKDKPLQRPDSQSRVSYVLWSSFMISMELASTKCSICSFQLV